MTDFEINFTQIGGDITVVNVYGYLDAHTFEYMESAVDQLFQDGNNKVVINLENVDYISSAGAGVFIGAVTKAQEAGGNILLMKPRPSVREVFDLLGLSQLFIFTDTDEDAILYFRGLEA